MVEKPAFADSQEPFGSEYPTTSAMMREGVFQIDEPNALPTPCEMVSKENTSTDIPKLSRNWSSGVADLPNDNLNGPY
jgi:hypothetical protein